MPSISAFAPLYRRSPELLAQFSARLLNEGTGLAARAGEAVGAGTQAQGVGRHAIHRRGHDFAESVPDEALTAADAGRDARWGRRVLDVSADPGPGGDRQVDGMIQS
ncbi:MAG TPA: hypothetical protein PKL28_12470 [Rhodocyclaceae bacterium]|nr:hypothetical protein [Rhodocyclaceae bacterium]HMW77480.1 hypothetical protein [Rhodocyclaceae bacterium]HNM81864.1 hypothetical protein [Rhodocyclaceae bacterium]